MITEPTKVWVFDYEVAGGDSGGFRWNINPELLLKEMAEQLNPSDDDMYEPLIRVTWIGQVEVELGGNVTSQVEDYLMGVVWQ